MDTRHFLLFTLTICFVDCWAHSPWDNNVVTRNYLELRSRKPNPSFKWSECTKEQFRCINGHCILKKWLCDTFDDCGDYSDEYDCKDRSGCPRDRFDCGNSQCYDRKFLCDGDVDCANGADEKAASCQSPSSSASPSSSPSPLPLVSICEPGRFKCGNSQCIDQSLVCNNEFDCTDHSDEAGCVYCSPVSEFACKSLQTNRTTQCIGKEYICDGTADCSEGQDENLTICNVLLPSTASYKSRPHRPEIEWKKDQSDQSSRCPNNQFHCSNGQCVNMHLVCDGQFDCDDASDEIRCPNHQYHLSPSNSLDILPLSSRYVKPGIDLKLYDTPQTQLAGDDVVFRCRDEGRARSTVQWTREDGGPFPPGTTDINGRLTMYSVTTKDSGVYLCKTTGPHGEKVGQAQLYVLPRTRSSRPIAQLFAQPQLTAAATIEPISAELRSPITTTITTSDQQCLPLQIQCSSGECIDRSVFCNSYNDCKDASDEKYCVKRCIYDQFRCANLFQCISKKDRCDGVAQCYDGSDEFSCNKTRGSMNNLLTQVDCSFSQFKCGDGSCIPHSYQCDGYSDCLDASDEDPKNCRPPRIETALPKRMLINEGTTLSLNCTAYGSPVPSIRWRFNHLLIGETTRSSVCTEKCFNCSPQGSTSTSTLKIYQVTLSDAGLYTCEAENALKVVISNDALVSIASVKN